MYLCTTRLPCRVQLRQWVLVNRWRRVPRWGLGWLRWKPYFFLEEKIPRNKSFSSEFFYFLWRKSKDFFKNIFFILNKREFHTRPLTYTSIHFSPYFPAPLSFFFFVSRQQQAYLQTVSLSFDLWTRNLWPHRRREWQFFDSFRSRWGEHFTSYFG